MLPHLSPSGEVSFIPQQHTLCAFCRTSFLMCQCTGLEYGKDFVFVGLPPPPANATRAMLLMRWVSLVRMSRSMGSFNGGRWYNDNFKQLNASMNARTALLNEMMDEYVAQLPTDTLRASLAEVLGLENGPMTEQVKGIASEAWASLRIFLSGDWALGLHVLFGYLTLEECFELSDPEKYRLDDPHLREVFYGGVDLVNDIMSKGFDEDGRCLAMEPARRPCVIEKDRMLPTSDERLVFTWLADHWSKYRQIMRFAGTNPRNSDERAIQTILSFARTMMLCLAIHRHEMADPRLWSMCVNYAVRLSK